MSWEEIIKLNPDHDFGDRRFDSGDESGDDLAYNQMLEINALIKILQKMNDEDAEHLVYDYILDDSSDAWTKNEDAIRYFKERMRI
tara:strand:+ start:39 stop:296 length:258 start_codon:yes stop_codon:yes gene_type:complete